jgi:alpha-1,3-rhamnosyl/mannosyltransferase
VRYAGQVDTAELIRIYHAATVLVYPSFYEGFCLPVVEAMATGLPVVASRAGAIPEVAGGAASLHDPEDVEGMTARIAEIWENPSLRKQMAAAGREAARRFSPEGHGHAVASVYREVAAA